MSRLRRSDGQSRRPVESRLAGRCRLPGRGGAHAFRVPGLRSSSRADQQVGLELQPPGLCGCGVRAWCRTTSVSVDAMARPWRRAASEHDARRARECREFNRHGGSRSCASDTPQPPATTRSARSGAPSADAPTTGDIGAAVRGSPPGPPAGRTSHPPAGARRSSVVRWVARPRASEGRRARRSAGGATVQTRISSGVRPACASCRYRQQQPLQADARHRPLDPRASHHLSTLAVAPTDATAAVSTRRRFPARPLRAMRRRYRAHAGFVGERGREAQSHASIAGLAFMLNASAEGQAGAATPTSMSARATSASTSDPAALFWLHA